MNYGPTSDSIGLGAADGGSSATASSHASTTAVGTPSSLSNFGTVTATAIASVPVGSADMSRSGRRKWAQFSETQLFQTLILSSRTATAKAQALGGYFSGGSSAPPTPSYTETGLSTATLASNVAPMSSGVESDPTAASSHAGLIDETAATTTNWLDTVDPNEPRYCLCNQVSYGEMVGCDSTEARIRRHLAY